MNPRTMTAWTSAGDGIAELAATTLPVPVPGPSEILVRITAWSLSYRDLLVINGVEGWRPLRPVIPVSDAVGIEEQAFPGTSSATGCPPPFFPDGSPGH